MAISKRALFSKIQNHFLPSAFRGENTGFNKNKKYIMCHFNKFYSNMEIMHKKKELRGAKLAT